MPSNGSPKSTNFAVHFMLQPTVTIWMSRGEKTMMRLTYILHSGFLLETEHCVLVFDYWMDPANVLHRYMGRSQSKPFYVFASHFHEDHFTSEIFRWRTANPSICLTYILSKDILRHHRASRDDADVWLAKGGVWQDEHIKVTATGSNDSGVSWVVEVAGKRIFHAGDLCNWYARFLTTDDACCDIHSDEMGVDVNPVAEEKRYLGELKDIAKVATSFDLVMFPVDGRIGNGYTLGARQFISRFHVGMFVPMHFTMSGCESAWRMAPFCDEHQIPFWRIRDEGDCMTLLEDNAIRHAAQGDVPRVG